MNRTVEAALVGALTGALASLPTTYMALRLTRKTSNVLLLAPQDEQQLARYAQQFGGAALPGGAVGPHGPGCRCGHDDKPTGQYL